MRGKLTLLLGFGAGYVLGTRSGRARYEQMSATAQRLWHDPRRRQCTLASLTTFTYEGDRIVSVGYSEPARDLVPPHLLAGAKPVKGKSKAFGA